MTYFRRRSEYPTHFLSYVATSQVKCQLIEYNSWQQLDGFSGETHIIETYLQVGLLVTFVQFVLAQKLPMVSNTKERTSIARSIGASSIVPCNLRYMKYYEIYKKNK